jgi:rSAM/selenodomain-associated transferase 1
MFKYPDYKLLTFTKSPVLGQVKTRMQPRLSQKFSLDLHSLLTDYCLTQFDASKICPVNLWLSGDKEEFFSRLAKWQKLIIHQQIGQDLGERMHHASKQALDDTTGVLIVGTDCPFIDAEYLSNACQALAQYDTVIGPAMDGGYVLFGIKNPNKKLFENVQWGGESVFAQTLLNIESLKLSCYRLPVLADIDRPEDLISLRGIRFFQPLIERYDIANIIN